MSVIVLVISSASDYFGWFVPEAAYIVWKEIGRYIFQHICYAENVLRPLINIPSLYCLFTYKSLVVCNESLFLNENISCLSGNYRWIGERHLGWNNKRWNLFILKPKWRYSDSLCFNRFLFLALPGAACALAGKSIYALGSGISLWLGRLIDCFIYWDCRFDGNSIGMVTAVEIWGFWLLH